MLQLKMKLGDRPVEIRKPETDLDIFSFRAWVAQSKLLGLDTETTGLDIYAPGHKLRLVQFGDDRKSYVLDAERYAYDIRWALGRENLTFVCHNAPYDLLVLDRHLGVPAEQLLGRTLDTRIMSHLIDPRARQEGGTGHGLKELAAIHVSPDSPDSDKALHAVFKEWGFNGTTGWAGISIDHPEYIRYAGVDTIITLLLFDKLAPIIRDCGFQKLSKFEHDVQAVLTLMMRRGIKVDLPYTEQLSDRLQEEASHYSTVSGTLGVSNINSTRQIAAVLQEMGEDLWEKTPSGQWKVDNAVLLPLADLTRGWERVGAREPNPLADAVLRAKRAEKWDTAYVQAFRELSDADGRLHPWISGLQARTARMSISRPALQQLPASDWTIRRALVADEGQTMFSVDYQAVEMRVLAAICQDHTMLQALTSGEDLHSFTAGKMYGEGFTKAQRTIAKTVGFGKIYGGGADTITRQTGANRRDIEAAISAYDRTFPGVKRYARRLQEGAQFGKIEIVTRSGRHLPLDRDRIYSALNYEIQSTARDVFAEALIKLYKQGLGKHLLLPIHDEVLGQAPHQDVEEIMREVAAAMRTDFYGVDLVTDGEITGPTWGHGYGAPS